MITINEKLYNKMPEKIKKHFTQKPNPSREEVVSLFPSVGEGNGDPYNYSGVTYNNKDTSMFNGDKPQAPSNYNDSGSAARFFYTAKASQEERNFGLYDFEDVKGGSYQFRQDGSLDGKIPSKRNIHPTVKPIDLMRYLVRLVTPKDGICLDPYLGSGTTAIACEMEKFSWIGIELMPEYAEIAKARISAVKDYDATLDTKTIIKESIKEDKEEELGIMNIFDFMYEPITFDKNKPIKLFEAFSGIGTQSLGLKYLGIKVEHIGISEVDHHAIKSYRAIHGKVKNYGGIGSFDKLPTGVDIATWSFPCQDISLAGKQKGMEDGTRSNYGYVFLDTIENMDYKDRPKVLLMENVKALFSEKFKDDWRNIQLRLENMGYKNYADSLIATDYGVPQTRDRVFIVSVKGEFSYTFPKPIPLVKKLKDYLEDEVDEKYYLSDKQIEQIVNWKAYNKPLENAKSENDETIQTITAKSNTSMNSSMVLIKEATKKGYAIAEDGDAIYIDRPHQKRGVVQKRKIQTLKTSADDIAIVLEGDAPINHIEEDYVVITIEGKAYIKSGRKFYRIRKITPTEAFRLMGIKDEDFHKAKSSGTSDSQLYKQAGNAIVVDVLMAIFSQMIK